MERHRDAFSIRTCNSLILGAGRRRRDDDIESETSRRSNPESEKPSLQRGVSIWVRPKGEVVNRHDAMAARE
jgi:hypothetical protein